MVSNRVARVSGAEQKGQEIARERALTQSRRVPCPQLLDALERYLAAQEFYFWARSIIEAEQGIPDWLMPLVEQRCPQFPDHQRSESKSKTLPDLALDLWDCIEEQCCGVARRDGWFDAIEFFAVRHPRYQRAQACWLQCRRAWQEVKPDRYPDLDEWRRLAANSAPETLADPEASRFWDALERVSPEHLEEAVHEYVDWEAFTYWVRTPLETSPENLPAHVLSALQERCPGFVECDQQRPTADGEACSNVWSRLIEWGNERLFAEAKDQGWMDAIVHCVSIHPRSLRTQDYWLVWDGQWTQGAPYPSFGEWLRQADEYVETDAIS